jgi:hypothetical protein
VLKHVENPPLKLAHGDDESLRMTVSDNILLTKISSDLLLKLLSTPWREAIALGEHNRDVATWETYEYVQMSKSRRST